MSKVKFITDSGCDITKEDELQYEIDVMPFQITLGDETFNERVDIEPQEFYEKITTSPHLPKTSQITSLRFEEKFLQCFEEGYDELVVVLINSTGSKTYENAVFAKNKLYEERPDIAEKMKIHLVDSHGYSVGYGYVLVEAVKKYRAGQSIPVILAFLEDWFNCMEIYIVGFDLRHMKKSGRISAAAAFLGELMGLRPVISLIDGESSVVKKVRGDKNVITEAAEYISKRMTPKTPWLLLRTTVTEQEDLFIQQFTKLTGTKLAYDSYSGCAVSSNAGPKMMGIVIKGEPRR